MTPLRDLITITRPMLGFDLETTSTNPDQARIVEIGLEIMIPGQATEEYRTLVNPGIPIPHTATYGTPDGKYKGHGITDAMVADAPTFDALSGRLRDQFEGVDFAGYNIRFDLKVITAEFKRARRPWSYEGARVIDAFRLWQVVDPRGLGDAIAHWLPGEVHPDQAVCACVDTGDGTSMHGCPVHDRNAMPHNALWDTKMSTAVVAAQLLQCSQLPRDLQALHELCSPGWYDAEGKLQWKEGVLCFSFGKHRGVGLADVVREDRGYVARFIMNGDFSAKVKDVCALALRGLPLPAPNVGVTVPELGTDSEGE